MLKELLQGKPFKHPLHPMLVHLPIGLFGLSLLFDLASLGLASSPTLVQAAFYTLVLGEGMALVAAVPGLVDWWDIRVDQPGKKTANTHLILNVLAVGLYAVNGWLRFDGLNATSTPWAPLLLSLAGMGLLTISGYLGGILVYDNGIAVGRHRRRTPTPSRTITIFTSEPDTRYARIAGAAHLPEGETLRVEIDDLVMTLVNHQGQLYAIQEFCTHRFGPLSQGTFHNGQVECPWHRSCFDLSTGAVTRGPARHPIRTFEVVIDKDDVFVRTGDSTPQRQQKPEGVPA